LPAATKRPYCGAGAGLCGSSAFGTATGACAIAGIEGRVELVFPGWSKKVRGGGGSAAIEQNGLESFGLSVELQMPKTRAVCASASLLLSELSASSFYSV